MTLDTMVGETIHMELWRRGTPAAALAPVVGVSQSVMSKKLRGRVKWSLEEIYRASRFLEIPVTDLLPPEDGVELPHMDSNHEPCDFWLAPLASDLPVVA